MAETLAQSEGVSKILVAQHEGFIGFLPGVCVCVCVYMSLPHTNAMGYRGTDSTDS